MGYSSWDSKESDTTEQLSLLLSLATSQIIYKYIPIERGAWWATVHGVVKSWAQPSDFHFTLLFMNMGRVVKFLP